MFDSFFDRGGNSLDESGLWAPATDISETKDDVLVSIELPGMKKDEIKVTVQDNLLTIRGEKKQEKEQKDTNYHRMERSYGFFSRSFSLPTTIKEDKIKANYEEGVLKVWLPKADEVKPKEIPVSISAK
jgi:HSP20 family protein